MQHLSELQPAPSVGMHEVPRESLSEHLGFEKANGQDKTDELDEQLAREYSQYLCTRDSFDRAAEHTRFVYGLQEAMASDESDDASSFSDESSSSRRRGGSRSSRQRTRGGKKRMSIVTGKYFDVPRLEESGHGYYDYGQGNDVQWGKGQGTKRRFFQSAARWDPYLEKVLVEHEMIAMPRVSVAGMMAMGGRSGNVAPPDDDEMDVDDGEEEEEEEEG